MKNVLARVDGLHEGRLGPDPGDQVTPARGCGSIDAHPAPRHRARRRGRRRARPRRVGAFPRPRRADRPVATTRSRHWIAFGVLLAAGAGRVLPVLHALRAERFGGVDRGDRALPADLHGVRRRRGRGAHEPPHPRRLPLPADAGARSGRVLSTLVDVVRIVFFAYAAVLTWEMMAEDGRATG